MTKRRKKTHPVLAKLSRMGGKARAKKLSPERRKEIAVNAIRARWARVREQQAAASSEGQTQATA